MPATLELPHTLHDTLLPRANTRAANDVTDPAKFLTIENVPVFAEHETVTKKGRKLRFSRHELQLVADCCNRRIEETGDYAAICIGHLPDADSLATNGTLPLVGLAGPFRVGLLGETDPKYVILADFHLLRGGTTWDGTALTPEQVMERFPRRSPELWVEDSYSAMFLDPICLLGAECPRLDMGVVYAAERDTVERYSIFRHADGREIERYSACAPAAGNVFLPGDGKKKYAADEVPTTEPINPKPKEDKPMAANLSPEDIQEIVSALMQTEQMAWVTSQMQATPGPEAAPTAPLEVPPAAPAAVAAPGAEAVPPPAEAAPPPAAEPVPPPAAAEPPMPSPSDAAPAVPAPAAPEKADEPEKVKEAANCGVSAVKYAKQQSEMLDMQRQLAELTEQLAAARKDISVANESKADTERYSRLSQIRRVRKFDLDREFERCKYAKMTGQQFDDHVTAITDNYTPIPLDMTLPTPDLAVMDNPARPGGKSEKVTYSKEVHDKAFVIAKQRQMAGESVDYPSIVRQVADGKL